MTNIVEAIIGFDSNLRIKNTFDGLNVTNLGTLKEDKPGTLSYLYDGKFSQSLVDNEGICACFVTEEIFNSIKMNRDCMFVISENPNSDFFLFHNYLLKETDFYGEEFETIIPDSSIVEPGAVIAPTNVVIGENVFIGSNVVIMKNSVIEDGVHIGANTTVGIEGTQISLDRDGKKFRVQHAGGVHVGKDTFVGANSVIVKSLFREKTTIGSECTIGNLVNIGHNTKIGNNVLVLANSVICGSTVVKDRARVSPGSFVASSLVVEEDAFVTLGSVVSRNVEKGQRVSGNFAIDHRKFLNHIKNISQ